MKIAQQIRQQKPIVHCITNIVTVNDCANILLAAGASPIMAHHPSEVSEVTKAANSLVCNMGALDDYEAMEVAACAAKDSGHPIVIDPVGVSGSSYRREKCIALMEHCHPSCIRGNYSEILALIKNCNTAAGVDAQTLFSNITSECDFVKQIQDYAKRNNVIIVASGKTDIVTDGNKLYLISSGDEMMTAITGSGCMASVIIGAFMAIAPTVEAVAEACRFFGEAGECAAEKTLSEGGGTMTFRTNFIDAVSLWDKEMPT